MKELRSCDGRLSGEHLISASVIDVLRDSGDFSISGVPWLEAGKSQIIGPASLTVNCLCSKHNSALSPLDDAAKYFFKALKSCLERKSDIPLFVLSGHDLERWLLKTVKAMAEAKILASDGQRLSGQFSHSIRLIDMLDDPAHWPPHAGLYCFMRPGERAQNERRFQLQPYTNLDGQLVGAAVNIVGLHFVVMFAAPNTQQHPEFRDAKYRPSEISIEYPWTRHRILISWEDARQPHQSLRLKFEREIKRQ